MSAREAKIRQARALRNYSFKAELASTLLHSQLNLKPEND